MKNYPVVRTDKMSGTDARIDLYSVRYVVETENATTSSVDKVPTEIVNGAVVKLGELEVVGTATKREVYEVTDVAADTPLTEVVLIAAPEVTYDERLRNLDDFINEAGTAARAYALHIGAHFGLTENAFDGTPKKGMIVELKAGHKLAVVNSLTSGSTKVGVIEAVEPAGKYTYFVVKVTG